MSSEWEKTTWGEVATLEYGKSIRDYQNAEGEFPVYGTNGPIGWHHTPLCYSAGVVIGRKGAYRGIHYSKKPFFVIDTAFYLKPKAQVNMKWAYYCLLTYDINGMDSGSAIPSTSRDEFYKLPVKIPSLTEQERIAEVLSMFDDRIALLRETNATLEAIAQAMFKSWFVNFDPVHAKQQGRAPEGMSEATAALFPDSFEESELGLVPRGWAVGSIGKVAEVIDCLHAKKPELLESGSPYLQLNNIRDDGLLDTANLAFVSDADYTKWISRIEVSGGDCVITNVGRVGAVAQIPESFRAAMGRNMTAIRMRKEWPYPTYLVELLQSPWMETEIQRRTDIGTILNALNVKNIPLLRCVLADHNLLKEFEDTARPLRAAMEANLERANNLATLRDTLLPRLISGQLRLPDFEGATQ